LALSLSLPDISFVGQFRKQIDPRAIYDVREIILDSVRERDKSKLEKIYQQNRTEKQFSNDFAARAKRSLQNTILYILGFQGTISLAKSQYDNANNMTDRIAALSSLTHTVSREREEAFSDFYERFQSYPLVVDKWFSLQGAAIRTSTLNDINKLKKHKDFNIKNPNRVRSLYASFAMGNPVCFHDENGKGYEFLADAIIELNNLNPQMASRLLTPLRDWRRYTPDRQKKMEIQLERICDLKDLSPDVYEVVNKTLRA